MSLTITKWLPIESEDVQLLFTECKHLQVESVGLVENLGLFLCDLKYNNIRKTHNNSIEIPFNVDDLEIITMKLKNLVENYASMYSKLKMSFTKILHLKMEKIKENLWKIKLKLMYLLHYLIGEIAHTYVYYGERILEITLTLSDIYNKFLGLVEKYENKYSICSNTCAYLLYPIRKITITKILQILAQKRAEICCHELIDCLLNTYKSNDNNDKDDASSDSSMEIYRALTRHMTPPMEVRAETSPTGVLSGGVQRQNSGSPGNEHFESMEDMIASEENNVILILTCAMQHAPVFLGSDGVKTNKQGETRLNSKAKTKVLEYYEQILWMEVGSCLEHIVLWWGMAPLSTRPPSSCHHLREWLAQFLPAAQDIPPYILSSLHSLADALIVHITSVSWDQFFRLALVSSKKANNPNTGHLFCETLFDLVQLSNQCEITSQWMSGAPVEDLPLVEQIPILHRLDHTVHITRLWVETETKRLANNWNVSSFFSITHTDVHNCLQQLGELRTADHSVEIGHGNLQVHTHVCANMRAKLVSEIKENIKKLNDTPKECINCLATVCRTLSLANLQMVFPPPSYWQTNGFDIPDIASSYVAIYLDRILTPIFGATTNDTICNMVLRIMCEAWLDHIYMNKIKFNDRGAYQLLRDFASVGDWLKNSPILSHETLKHMIKNEVLRKCEGVGRLLLRSPGEQLKMNTVPIETDKTGDQNGENEQLMPAEMYVPNQEQWLELRASKKKSPFITSCYC